MSKFVPSRSGPSDPCKKCGAPALLGWGLCDPCLKAINGTRHKLDLSGRIPRCRVCGKLLDDRSVTEDCIGSWL